MVKRSLTANGDLSFARSDPRVIFTDVSLLDAGTDRAVSASRNLSQISNYGSTNLIRQVIRGVIRDARGIYDGAIQARARPGRALQEYAEEQAGGAAKTGRPAGPR